jgi:hypothetical protein
VVALFAVFARGAVGQTVDGSAVREAAPGDDYFCECECFNQISGPLCKDASCASASWRYAARGSSNCFREHAGRACTGFSASSARLERGSKGLCTLEHTPAVVTQVEAAPVPATTPSSSR